jgi:tetratricopeptide (TPR) repeat protein
MAKLNAEVDTVTSGHYRAKSYPTIMVLRQDGTEIERVVGYSRAPEFIKEVEDYLAGRNTLASMEAEEATRGSDPAFVVRYAEKYYYHGLFDEARKHYHRYIELDPKNTTGEVDDALYTLARMSRKAKDYAADRRYAQQIVDRYADGDMYRPALLEIAGAWRREGVHAKARALYLDYATRFPDDEDAPWAREQADTLAVRIAAQAAGKGA